MLKSKAIVLFFKIAPNKNIQKTIFNIVTLYLTTTILLVVTLSYFYITTQQKQIFHLHKEKVDIQAQYIIENLELLHDNIINEAAIYPRVKNIQSAIFDKAHNLLFSTFTQQITLKEEKFFTQGEYNYFVYDVEPYYLGAAYLVIQKHKGYELATRTKKVLLSAFIVILFLIITSFIMAKLLIKPLSDNFLLLDRFIKDTTHELNTPLSAILNNIEMLDMDSINEKNRKKIQRIQIGATTISTIYDDLTFLLLNNNKKSHNELLNLSEVLQQRLEYFTPLAHIKHLDFFTEIAHDVFLTIDRLKLHRVFDNLLSNSIKYAYAQTIITITLTPNMFSIKDFGIGMEAKQVEQVFQRYKRFDTSVGGFGLGYSIIKEIIEEYHISIEIISTKHQGTEVILRW